MLSSGMKEAQQRSIKVEVATKQDSFRVELGFRVQDLEIRAVGFSV